MGIAFSIFGSPITPQSRTGIEGCKALEKIGLLGTDNYPEEALGKIAIKVLELEERLNKMDEMKEGK